MPPFVQVTSGPEEMPTASVADNVADPVPADATLKVDGLKETAGDVTSATGVGVVGAGVVVLTPPPPPPPPQADKSSADAIDSVGR